MWHPDFCSGYPEVLEGSGLVLAVLLLGYPTVQDESGLVPAPLVLGKGYLEMSLLQPASEGLLILK